MGGQLIAAKPQLISIVVPLYNEADNLEPLYKEVNKHTRSLPYRFEMIFVDDGSTDDSPRVLRRLANRHPHVRLIHLARNFGKEAAMTAGLRESRGDAVVILDADLQMPPRLLREFIDKWQRGAEVVVGIFSSRHMGWFRKFGAHVFYRIMQAIANTKLTPHATDYRLLDRNVVNAYNQLTERNRITRGLVDWLGFERDYVHFEQAERLSGTPNYSMRKLIGLAVNSLTSHSLVPLKLAGYLGVAILSVAVLSGLFMFVERFILGDPLNLHITNTAFIAMTILFAVGVMLACLGLISLYIAHIHAEVVNRPLYVIRHMTEPEPAEELKTIAAGGAD